MHEQLTTRLSPEWELYRWQAYANNWKLFHWWKWERGAKSWQKYCSSQANKFDFRSFPNEHLIWYHHQNTTVTRQTEKKIMKKKAPKTHAHSFKHHEKAWVILYKRIDIIKLLLYGIVVIRSVHMCMRGRTFLFSFGVWIWFEIVCASKHTSVTYLIKRAIDCTCDVQIYKCTNKKSTRNGGVNAYSYTYAYTYTHIFSLKSKSNQHHSIYGN